MNKKYTIDILQELVGDKYIILDNYISSLTRREQEIPHLYRWWDELR